MIARRPSDTGRVLVPVALVLALLWAGVGDAAGGAPNDPGFEHQWGLETIGAPEAWRVGDGRGMVIAIVDTGVDLGHEDLADKLVPGIDLVDRGTSPQDRHGHGTHVAGIAAAITNNGRGIAGAAPRARIMPVRVLDAEGSGTGSDVNEGVRWAADHGAHVINLSLGRSGQQLLGPGFSDAVRYAWARGAVVVVAAGNDFVLSSGFSDEPALVVSATTRNDRKPNYSSGVGSAQWGMAAPGGGCQVLTCPIEDDILSTWWTSSGSNEYRYLMGTSMAAPHVAGAAAVLRSLGLTPQQTVDRLLATAVDIGPSGRDSTFGHGRLDMAAAVAGLGGSASPSPSPTASPSPSPTASPSPSPAPTANPSPTASPPPTPSPAPTSPPPGPGSSPAPTESLPGAPGDPSPVEDPPPPDDDRQGSVGAAGDPADVREPPGSNRDEAGDQPFPPGDDPNSYLRSGLAALALGLAALTLVAWTVRYRST